MKNKGFATETNINIFLLCYVANFLIKMLMYMLFILASLGKMSKVGKISIQEKHKRHCHYILLGKNDLLCIPFNVVSFILK